MPPAGKGRLPRLCRALAGAVLCAAPAAAGEWHAVQGAGILPGLPAWRALHEAARLPAAPPAEGAGERELPLPLSPDAWRRLLGRPGLADGELAGAIAADRRASALYLGLSAFDDETLAAVAADPGVLEAIRDRHADVLATLGGRFEVRNGVVAVPGGEEAEPLWAEVVGESPRSPARFLLALVRSGEGRRAFLWDSVARVDAATQRFAVGLDLPRAEDRVEALRRLAAVFDRERPWWRSEGAVYARPEADAARLLREVRLRDGALAPPSSRRFWAAVFGDAAAASAGGEDAPADAAWLAERIGTGDPAVRRRRLLQLTFAQRALGESGDALRGDVFLTLLGLAEAETLVLALERMGVRDPRLYADGVRAARAAARHGGADGRRVQRGLQGALAVVERARGAGTLDEAVAAGLARSLFAVPFEDARAWATALADWLEGALLPALARAIYGERPAGDPETVLLRGMAGDTVDDEAGLEVFDWEGLSYRADVGRAEFLRLEQVRARQNGVGLAEGLAACRAAGAEDCGERLGASLASLVYAAHLGEPDGPALSGSDPAARHDFGDAPWARPAEVWGAGVRWHVRGSLIGLEGALARLSLHRLDGDALPEEPPVLDAWHGRALAAAVAPANPRELTDAGRDAIAAAIEAGRRRVALLRPGTAATEAVEQEAGLDPWRARALDWLLVHEPAARDGFFSLAELLRLGGGGGADLDAWGVADPIGCGLGVRFPGPVPLDEGAGRGPQVAAATGFVDLNLRVASHLALRRVPAAVAPEVVRALLPDLLATAKPLRADDRLGLEEWVRALPAERIDDAVAALAVRGPLQPAPPVAGEAR